MIQLKLAYDFLTTYWKDIAIGIIIAFSAFIFMSWLNGTAEIGRLKTQLTMASQLNDTLQAKVNAFESAEQAAKDNQAKSLKDREIIVTTLTKEINKLRSQVIPKDCNGAVAYGIQFKDDMKWPQERSSQ